MSSEAFFHFFFLLFEEESAYKVSNEVERSMCLMGLLTSSLTWE